MSRRKQSNPKPLKVDEGWNEGEEGGGKQNENKALEEQEGSPKSNQESTADNQNPSDDQDSENLDPARPESNSSSEKLEKLPTDKLKIPVYLSKSKKSSSASGNSGRQSPTEGHCETRVRNRRQGSDLVEYSEVDTTSETEESDDRRRSRRESEGSVTRRKSPEIPKSGSEMNGTLTVPLSSQQLLQGLPYLHLLPPSIRNDAARLLFMPPVPQELSGNVHSSTHSNSASSDVEKATSTENSRSGPGYFCKPCNIKFSSARTLDAHQTYYCSFRRDIGKEGVKSDLDGDSKTELMTAAQSGSKKQERESADEDRELMAEESMEISAEGRVGFNEVDMNPNKIAKTGKLYSCMYCSYSADKKVSLNRHMRMHSGTSISSLQASNSNDENMASGGSTTPSNANVCNNIGLNKNLPEGVNALERYCQDCDIQFSSIKTFRVHKQYYCRTRHVLKAQQSVTATGSPTPGSMKSQQSIEQGGSITVTPVRKNSGSPVPSDGSPASTPGPMQSQPFVVLPTNPLIIVPYCYIQAASILPGNVLPSQNALVVLPNGSVQGLPFTAVPIPIPSPSAMSQAGMASLLSQSAFSTGSTKNNGIGSMTGGGHGCSSVSPTSQSHSVFNDPKDILRKISSASKGSSRNTDSVSYESAGSSYKNGSPDDTHTSPNISDETVQSVNGTFFKGNQAVGSDEHLDKSHEENCETRTGNDEAMPAIDLTLRKTHSTKEISGDEEKENREVCLRLQNPSHDQYDNSYASDANNGRKPSTGVAFSDFHRDRDLCSPSERFSIGSGSCGKRTPRPSSTSISSSCSTPPALCEPKVNGIMNRLSPVAVNHETVSANKTHTMMSMMMSPGLGAGEILKKGSVDFAGFDLGKHKLTSMNSGESKGKRGKISHIATQLPGGAILTTSGNQSLTDLLMSNSQELNETLAKINPQLLMNSRSSSGSPIALNPAVIQALSQTDPEILMRMLDPVYLSNLQQTIQQQQQLQQQGNVKRGYSKCIECDIVFYKHENYLVHKEHYCAARISNSSPNGSKNGDKEVHSSHGGKDPISSSRISSCSSPAKSEVDGEESQTSPSSVVQRAPQHNQINIKVPRKSTDSSSSDFFPLPVYEKNKSRSPQGLPSAILISPVPSPNERKEGTKDKHGNAVGSQYSCAQCGVKYSTIDNLKAHQSFYCTKRRGMNDSTVSEGDDLGPKLGDGQNSQPLSGNVNNKGLSQCGKCKLAIPEDQLSTHTKVCLGSNGSIQYGPGSVNLMTPGEGRGVGWKCPCCDTYSPTVSAAQKHLEIHTGIKAFKCLLCGYRGNTLRGMRTHIRTHFDKRVSDLLEGDYMTCITANEVEHGVSTLPVANKLLSSISEARSQDLNHHHESTNRQAMEKTKLNPSPTTPSVTTSSPGSPQELQDIKVFSGPEGSVIDAEKLENNNRHTNCSLCSYSSSYRGNIIRHMKLVHKISEESADKILTEMSSMKVHSTTEEDYNDTNDRKLNISPALMKAHSKEMPGAVSNYVSRVSTTSGNVNATRRKDINGREPRDERSESDTGERNCAGRSSSTEEDMDGLSTLQKKEKPCAVKYCKSCDIYFNHLSTFDAHKKSYCSAGLNNKTTERAETPVQ